jgi:hypothetical protein
VAYGMRKAKEIKRFICYSLYAWGLPCVATFLTFMTDTYIIVPENFNEIENFKAFDKIRPKIGERSCWFGEDTRQRKAGNSFIFFLFSFLSSRRDHIARSFDIFPRSGRFADFGQRRALHHHGNPL